VTIERLSGVLTAIGAPATAREIAEMLWLGCHITPAEEDAGGSRRPAGRNSADSLPRLEPDPAVVGKRESARDVIREAQTPDGDARTGLFPKAASGPVLNAGEVFVPAAPMIGNALAIERALRPLKRTVPSEHESELDEDATANRIADQPPGARDWVPVLRHARERWLSLAFVVDTGPSMQVWQPMAEELREVFARLAAFRDLRTWYLRDGEIAATPGGLPQHPAGLLSPASSQAVLVLSDCSGPHWWNGRAQRALSLWGEHAVTAILQPLSERLWRRTALPPVPGIAFLKTAGAPNTELFFRPHDAAADAGIPVPVVEISADWLADWASLLLGPSGSPVQAAACFVSQARSVTDTPLRREQQLPISERVRRFQETASPDAVWLASCLAVSVPTLPVLRLIQHQMLGGRRGQPSHLAEVLLSGLLRPRDERRQAFEFVAGAREALIASMPRSRSWYVADVLSRISAEIEARAGRARDTFSAFQRVPEGTGGRTLRDDQPFALVSAEAIQYLRRSVAPTPPPPQTDERGPDDRQEQAPEPDQAREQDPAGEEVTSQAVTPSAATPEEEVSPSVVYLSYVPEDRAWADWIAALLEQRGIRAVRPLDEVLPEHQARAGAALTAAGADRTIAVLSAGYLKSPLAQGIADELAADTGRASGWFIPVRVGDVLTVPPFDNGFVIDMVRRDEASATEELLGALGNPPMAAGHFADSKPRFPRTNPPVWRVPARNPSFIGRADVLAELHDQWAGSDTPILTLALHGPADIGKTQIAIEYAHRFVADYDLVWWIPSDSLELIANGVAELAEPLGISPADSTAETVELVKEALRLGRPYDRWLLIFDNANEPAEDEAFFPGGPGGHVVVTSRSPGWSQVAEPVSIHVFSRSDSVASLQRQVPGLTAEEAFRVADALGDLPLAIEHAGVFLAATGMPAAEYIEQLRDQLTATMDLSLPSDYPTSAVAAYRLSFDRLKGQSPAAARLLELCAFFGPDPISLDLLYSHTAIDCLVPYDSRLRETPTTVGRLAAQIASMSLAKIDYGASTLQVHRLIQAVLRDQMTHDERDQTRHDVHRILAGARPRRDVDDPETWRRFDLLWPHLGPSEAWSCEEPETRQLLIDRVRYLSGRGEFADALDLARDLERRWQELLGTDDIQALSLRSQLANVLRTQCRFSEAREVEDDIYQRQRRVLGEDHLHTLMIMGGLAADLRGLGEFGDALALDEQAYARFRDVYGDEYQNTLSSADNLAVDLRLVGDFRRARDLNQWTWDQRQVVLGPGHPSTLRSAAMLGRDLRDLGDYPRSVGLLQETHERYVAMFGEDVAYTLRAATSLAVSLRKSGQVDAAYDLTRGACDRYERYFGRDNLDALACKLNLAAALSARDDHAAALETARQVMDAYARIFGSHHALTLVAANNVSVYQRQTGAPGDALQVASVTLEWMRRRLGEEHPFTLACAVNTANCMHYLARLTEAEELLRVTHDRLRRSLGDSHPDTLACAENLAVTLWSTGRRDEATALRESAISVLTQTFGDDLPLLRMIHARSVVNIELEVPPV
jgi:hypothetical protein